MRRAVDNAPCSLSCTSDDSSPASCLSDVPSFVGGARAEGRYAGYGRSLGRPKAPEPARHLSPSRPQSLLPAYLHLDKLAPLFCTSYESEGVLFFCNMCKGGLRIVLVLQSLLYAILYRACPAGGMSSMLLPCHCRSSLAIIATGWIGPAPWASEQGSDATLKHYAPTLLLARSAVWVCTVTDLRHVILDKSPLCRERRRVA
ncbi:hypothetical protein CUC08_Gglean004270 [Alternaria sp. MG1]|nr:hypothetical protein CUC08_Gglean004270 [Alternaria sp. MG1]